MPLFVVFTSISVLAVVLGILFNISQGQLLLTYHSHNMSFNLWVVTYISIAILFLICSFTKIIIKYNTFKKSLFERKHDNKIQKIKAAWIAYLESPITYKHNTLTELNNLICEDDMDLNNFLCLLDLKDNKINQALSKWQNTKQNNSQNSALIHAYILIKNNKFEAATEVVKSQNFNTTPLSTNIKVQLLIHEGKIEEAINKILEINSLYAESMDETNHLILELCDSKFSGILAKKLHVFWEQCSIETKKDISRKIY